MPNGTFDDDRGAVSIGPLGDNVSLKPSVLDVGCEMMVDFVAWDDVAGMPSRRCGRTPTVGTNGLYRYCRRHMRMVADAGATTLQYDDARVVDCPDASSSIGSDAPASVHGAADRPIASRTPH